MKKLWLAGRLLVRLGILMTILGVAAVCIAVAPLGSMIGSMTSVARNHNRLKTRNDAHELGAVMAGALRDTSLKAEVLIYSDDSRMPARLRALGASYLSLDPNRGSARLEFGGGFYHYGYEIQAEGPRDYRMVCYGEAEKDLDDLGTFQYTQEGEQAGTYDGG